MSSLEEPKFLQRLGEELIPKRALTPKQQLRQEIMKKHETAEQEEQEEEEEFVEEPAITITYQELAEREGILQQEEPEITPEEKARQEEIAEREEQERIKTLRAVEADIEDMIKHQEPSCLPQLPKFLDSSYIYQRGDVLLQLYTFHYFLPDCEIESKESSESEFSGEEFPAVEKPLPQPEQEEEKEEDGEQEEGKEEDGEQGYLPVLKVEFPVELQGKRRRRGFNWRQASWREHKRSSECKIIYYGWVGGGGGLVTLDKGGAPRAEGVK